MSAKFTTVVRLTLECGNYKPAGDDRSCFVPVAVEIAELTDIEKPPLTAYSDDEGLHDILDELVCRIVKRLDLLNEREG